jgi:hypothetical protein
MTSVGLAPQGQILGVDAARMGGYTHKIQEAGAAGVQALAGAAGKGSTDEGLS